MKKQLVVLGLVILILTSFVFADDCLIGIDDYCDPNCIDVDYDCPNNPYIAQQDSVCILELDGICDENCMDYDKDCILRQEEQIAQEVAVILEHLKEERSDDTIYIVESEVDQSILSSFQSNSLSRFQLVLLALGLIFLGIFILLIFYHLKKKKDMVDYSSLLPYGQAALEKGYSREQIKKSLESQGYDAQFINGYLKTLEHRP